jgi:sugar phosphate permease
VDRYGPRFALSFGGLLGASSLILYWLVAREFIQLHRVLLVPTLSMLGVLIFTSSALITGSVFKIIVGTCGPGSKGSAVGAAKGFVGLGAGAYSCLFESLRLPWTSDLDFLPMAAFFSIVAATIPSLLLLPSKKHIQLNPEHDRIRPLHLRLLYASLIGLAIMVVGTSLSELKEEHASPDDGDL